MKPIDIISYYEFKSRMLKEQRKLLEEEIRRDCNKLGETIQYPQLSDLLPSSISEKLSGKSWINKFFSALSSLLKK